MGQLGATHAGAIERHQQCSSKQCPGGVDQTRDFFWTEHSWQPAPILRIGQELAELMPLKRLDEEEPQRCYTVHSSAGCYFALLEQVGLIASQLIRPELIRGLAKMASERNHVLQVLARRDLGVVAALEFLQHHLA